MKTSSYLISFLVLSLFLFFAVSAQAEDSDIFYKGADLGWLSEMEHRGCTFQDVNGNKRECMEMLKNDYGLNAIRLRVWVNPEKTGNWSSAEDVLKSSLRAKELGMDVMIDFHYSDHWADPGHQNIPAAWSGKSYNEVKALLAEHTRSVLQLLKDHGVTPRWVQVGNETSNGLLWSARLDHRGWVIKDSLGRSIIDEKMGDIKTHPMEYAGYIRAGYDAVKEVFPQCICIVHLDNGYDQKLYDRNLDTVLAGGGRFDMVGMSLYPYWTMEAHPEYTAERAITECIANIKHVAEKYHCPVMIVETGYEVNEHKPEVMLQGRDQLSRLIRESRATGVCKGVFYWEPECKPSQYKLGAFTESGQPTAIMDGFKE